MTHEQLVEKVARAIYEGRNGHGCTPWSIRNKAHKEPYQADARAALEAAEAAAWEPIESAPKDGTEILAFAVDPVMKGRNYIAVAQWSNLYYLPNSVAGWFWPYAIRPTHWRPLPQPPKEAT